MGGGSDNMQNITKMIIACFTQKKEKRSEFMKHGEVRRANDC